ncbi:MAG: sigma-70 family RNA polymerase sigma factor [bacterium]|nr:sigma-70 family RNA polymerase sigma factor [bacterium]
MDAADVVERLQKGDKSIIDQLVREYSDHLFSASLGFGLNREDALELVQNVWLTFTQVGIRFEGRSSIRTFPFGILYNKAKDFRRSQAKYQSDQSLDEMFENRFDDTGHWLSKPLTPEKFLELGETRAILEACLDGLPDTQRRVFILKEVSGHSSEDICNISGVTATNLGVLLFRARARLRECIERKGEVSA